MRSKKRLSLNITGWFLILITLCISTELHAASLLTQRHSNRMMQGVRPLGMGNAFIAVEGTDENAIYYNPAAINDYPKEIHMQFVLPTVEFSYKSIDFFMNDVKDLTNDIDNAADDSARIAAFDQFTTNNAGRYEELGARGNIATFMHKYITASLFYENRSLVGINTIGGSTFELEALTQGGLIVGSAYSFFQDMLQAGVAVKFVGRHLIDETITTQDVAANSDFNDIVGYKDFGFGIGFDIGVKGRLPVRNSKAWDFLDPVFALTLQDIGHTRFFAGDPVGRQDQSLSFGYALHPKFWKLTSIFAMDIRDIDKRTDFLNKLHVGYELTWPEISKILRSVSVRIGLNQGYIGGGFGLDFKYFKLNAATYGREIGVGTYHRHSRMFAFQLAAGF